MTPTLPRYILGIDPGSGIKSPTGLALLDTKEMRVLWTKTIRPQFSAGKRDLNGDDKRARFVSVASQVGNEARQLVAQYGAENVVMHTEWFVMRGKGGETLQRLIGALFALTPLEVPIKQVHNLAVKFWASGNFRADKREVGNGLLTRVNNSVTLIKELLQEERWDEIDAIAIAYCGEFRDD